MEKSSVETGESLQQTSDGGYIIAGTASGFGGAADVYLIKTDALGNSNCNEMNISMPTNSVDAYISSLPQTSDTVGAVYPHAMLITVGLSSDSIICLITGINQPGSPMDNIFVYPNPTSGLITIDSEEPVDVEVYSIMGRKILQQNQVKEIDLSSYANGMYFIRLGNHQGVVAKIIKH